MAVTNRLGWRRTRGLGAVMLVIATVAVFGTDLRQLTARRPTSTVLADEDFDEGTIIRQTAATVSGFVPCAYGWCLPPGGEGSLTYSIDVPDAMRAVRLTAWLYRPPGVRNAVETSLDDGRSFTRVLTDTPLRGASLDVRAPARSRMVWRFSASNSGASPQLVLDKIVLMSLDRVAKPEVPRENLVLAFAGLAFAAALLQRRWRVAAATAAVLTVALYLRYGYLLAFASAPLDPDATGYLMYARSFALFGPAGFYSAAFGEREPMFVFVAHAFLRLVVDSPYGLRLLSLALSLMVVWAATALGRRLLGPFAGWLAGLALALNQPLAGEASRGLRLELEMLLWLAFLWGAFAWSRPRGTWKAVLIGALGGVLVLTRSTYLPVVIPLQAMALFEWSEERWHSLRRFAAHSVLAAVLTVCLFAPHRYALYARHGDPLWDTAGYARWNANMEFAGRPGFPSRGELQSNGYIGPRLSYSDYLFKLHTPRELVEGTVRGYYKLYRGFIWGTDTAPRSVSWWGSLALQCVGLVGFGLALLSWRWAWLPVAFILCEFAPSFLYDRQLVEPFRHTYQGLPLLVFAVLRAAQVVADKHLPARWTIDSTQGDVAGVDRPAANGPLRD
jgi:hypothetical protein